MALSSHILELQRKHRSLSDAIAQAQMKPGVDTLKISAMKKQKLALKEEIQRLETA